MFFLGREMVGFVDFEGGIIFLIWQLGFQKSNHVAKFSVVGDLYLILRYIFHLAPIWVPNSTSKLQLMANIELLWKSTEEHFSITTVKVSPNFLGRWFWILELKNCVKFDIKSFQKTRIRQYCNTYWLKLLVIFQKFDQFLWQQHWKNVVKWKTGIRHLTYFYLQS